MRVRAGFLDRGVGHSDQLTIKEDRLDIPNSFPRKIDISFLAEFFARGFCVAQHLLEGFSVEMALIERDSAFFDHAGDDSRFRRAGTDSANALAAAFGNFVN